jgi:hypothetical protein
MASSIDLNIRGFDAHYRRICEVVLDIYASMKGTLGNAQAVDYSQNTGWQGAQFKDTGFMFKCLDYIVDVENAARDCLNAHEYVIWEYVLKDNNSIPVQSGEYLTIRSKLGRMFKLRGLYPVSRYFEEVRVARVQSV